MTRADRILKRAIPLITRFEGYMGHPYDDGLGNITIGYGHVVLRGEHFGHITESQARALLDRDLRRRYLPTVVALPHPLSDRQAAAILSAVFNLGPGIVSTGHDLGRHLHAHRYALAANSLLEYVNPGSSVERGLRRRRKAERRMFLRGSNLKTRLRAARLRR
jgi:lysozyme